MREASNGVSISVSSPWEVAPRNQPPIAPAQSRRDEIASATDEIEAPPLTDPSRLRKQAGGPPTLPPHGRLTLTLTLALALALALALTLTLALTLALTLTLTLTLTRRPVDGAPHSRGARLLLQHDERRLLVGAVTLTLTVIVTLTLTLTLILILTLTLTLLP